MAGPCQRRNPAAGQFGEAAPGDTRVVLAAPQASIMKALVEGFMSHQPVAYILFGTGAKLFINEVTSHAIG